jgi:DNA-binding NtrC family response regulator
MPDDKLLDGKKVLIVDDEPDVLESLEDLLAMCEITTATNFERAQELMETRYFDLAIIDIMGVDGYELLKLANQRNMTAVMLTAHAVSPENVVRSFEGGAASYIPKEKMADITTFLVDILEAKVLGKHPWWRWYSRLSGFCDRTFGSKWKEDHEDLMKKIPLY